jgi:hypothetical protein
VRWLLRLYPRRWRERYGDEFLALVEERGVSIGALLDVLRGALDARLHPELGGTPELVSAGPSRAGRFDRFTRRSRTVLRLAQQQAEHLHQRQIGSEHLLLGLLLEGEGVAAHVLVDLGVRPDELHAAILAHLQPDAAADPRRLGLSPDARRAIELSVAEARRLRHHYLGTEHLLLGLVAETHGPAANLLRQHGVADLDHLRRHIIRALNEGGPHLRPPV